VKVTDSYRREQAMLHLDPEYGVASVSYAPIVAQIIEKLGVTELLDYGCGKAKLMEALKGRVSQKMLIQAYDPAIPGFSEDPVPMQMVTCIDVLEHIEPECLNAVLDDLEKVTGLVGFFTICTVPAKKRLSDGRNAHLIVKSPQWWIKKLWKRFDLQTYQLVGDSFYVIVYAKRKPVIETPKLEVPNVH